MRRATWVAGLALALAPAAAGAQAYVHFYVPDTALTILTNRTATAELRVSGVVGVSAYNITIFLDDSRLTLLAADTLPGYGLNPPTLTTGTEQVTLQASGPGNSYSTVVLARLTFKLDTLAPRGSLLSMRVNSLLNGAGGDVLPGHRTNLLQLCQAEQLGGDVSGDRVVNSRDALAVLTASVGLPTTGFDVGRPGDVDVDFQTTSRDALFILSYGIRLPVYGAPLVGVGLINKCSPLAAAPNDMVFWRSTDLYKIPAGDTIPAALGVTGLAEYYARWSPNGSKLVFAKTVTGYGYEVMVVNADGTGLDTLTLDINADFAPDWAPDSSKIAFVSNRVTPQSIFVMNPDGSVPTRLTTTHTVLDLAWSPDGARMAFTGYVACCSRRLWVVNADGSNPTEVFPGSDVHAPMDPVWSPSGDSLIYYAASRSRVYKVAGNGDTVAVSSLTGGQDSPWWANTAHLLRSLTYVTDDFFIRRFSDGRHLRLTHAVGTGDQRASVRRTLSPPTLYPETVNVTPDSIQLDPDSVDTLSVTVLDNTGAPIAVPVSWHSRDTTVAKVNATGIVTASKNAGVTYVVATAGWRKDSTKVVVAITLRSVSGGGYHSCGIMAGADSLAFCWGYNVYGQLGTGTTVSSTHPMRVAGGLKFASITIGRYHTCATTGAGTAYCWGYNGSGQIGDGTTTQRTVPTAVTGGSTFLAVEAGADHTCGVTTSNAGFCWGNNASGQLGDSTQLNRSTPTAVKSALPFASVSAAYIHTCGVLTTAEVVCWGYNADGRLGDSTQTSRIFPDTVFGGRSWASVSAFENHSCGIETGGAAFCWGYNAQGQLGDGTTANRIAPRAVIGGLVMGQLSAGTFHTCAVTTGNAPYCWGYGVWGQIGDGFTANRTSPTAVSGGLTMSAISAAQDFSCGVTTGNLVYCWGRNDYGQLGDGTTTQRLVPVRVAGQK